MRMRVETRSLAGAIALMLLAGCSGGDAAQRSEADPPEAAAETTPEAQAAAPAQPAAAGTARVTLRGEGVNVDGEFPAISCGSAAMPPDLGVGYVTRADGWTLSVANWEQRVPGRQTKPNAGITLNAPGGAQSYALTVENGAELTFGDDFKTAVIRGNAKDVVSPRRVQVEATFTCP